MYEEDNKGIKQDTIVSAFIILCVIVMIAAISVSYDNSTPRTHAAVIASESSFKMVPSGNNGIRATLSSPEGSILQIWTTRGPVTQEGDRYVFVDKDSGKTVSIVVSSSSGPLTLVDLQ